MVYEKSNKSYKLDNNDYTTNGLYGNILSRGDKLDIYLNFDDNSLSFVLNKDFNIGNCINKNHFINNNFEKYKLGIIFGCKAKIQLLEYDNEPKPIELNGEFSDNLRCGSINIKKQNILINSCSSYGTVFGRTTISKGFHHFKFKII